MKPKPLSPRQLDVMRFVQGYTFAVGWPPSLREISAAIGISRDPGANIDQHLDRIEAKGWIRREPNENRAITIIWWVTRDGHAVRPFGREGQWDDDDKGR